MLASIFHPRFAILSTPTSLQPISQLGDFLEKGIKWLFSLFIVAIPRVFLRLSLGLYAPAASPLRAP